MADKRKPEKWMRDAAAVFFADWYLHDPHDDEQRMFVKAMAQAIADRAPLEKKELSDVDTGRDS